MKTLKQSLVLAIVSAILPLTASAFELDCTSLTKQEIQQTGINSLVVIQEHCIEQNVTAAKEAIALSNEYKSTRSGETFDKFIEATKKRQTLDSVVFNIQYQLITKLLKERK